MTEQLENIYRLFITTFECGKTHSGIRKSFETLEKTGAHCYLDEIYDDRYKIVDKAHFSQNLMYIPGRFLIAYKDIDKIIPLSGINEYRIKMVDGQSYHICMLKVTYTELSKHLNPCVTEPVNSKLGLKDILIWFMILALFKIFGSWIANLFN